MLHDLPDAMFIQDGVPTTLVRPGRPLFFFRHKPVQEHQAPAAAAPARRSRRLRLRPAS